ncbi:MAG: acetaldehyde dehydrogenase [Thalassobius sp.]|nr:acetaldehyde dehydrogenase [Thalassovita sp.]
MIPRVTATEKTIELINELIIENGPLIFHQSGGCCDGSQPMCFPADEFKIGYSDVQLGEIGGVPFWMSGDQYEYWKHTQLTIDVVDGRGSSFSLEIPKGKRFIVKSRLFKDDEVNNLVEISRLED